MSDVKRSEERREGIEVRMKDCMAREESDQAVMDEQRTLRRASLVLDQVPLRTTVSFVTTEVG